MMNNMTTAKSKSKHTSASSVVEDVGSTSSRDIIESHQKKFDEFKEREDKYKQKVDNHLRKLIESRSELEGEVLRRGEKISDLQKALVELQVSYFEERERYWKLSTEFDQLKKNESKLHENIRQLLQLTKDKELHDRIIYILKQPRVEVGQRYTTDGEDEIQGFSRDKARAEAIRRLKQDMITPSDELSTMMHRSSFEDSSTTRMLQEQVQSLQSQLEEFRKMAVYKKDVGEDCKVSLEIAKAQIIEKSKENNNLKSRLQETERLFVECDNELKRMKEYLKGKDLEHENEIVKFRDHLKMSEEEHQEQLERIKSFMEKNDKEHEIELEKIQEFLKKKDKEHEDEIQSMIRDFQETMSLSKTRVSTHSVQTSKESVYKAKPKVSTHSVQTYKDDYTGIPHAQISTHSIQTSGDRYADFSVSSHCVQTSEEDRYLPRAVPKASVTSHSAQTSEEKLLASMMEPKVTVSSHSVQTRENGSYLTRPTEKASVTSHSAQTSQERFTAEPKVSVSTHSVQTSKDADYTSAPVQKVSLISHSVQTNGDLYTDTTRKKSLHSDHQIVRTVSRPRPILKDIHQNSYDTLKASSLQKSDSDTVVTSISSDLENMNDLLSLLKTAVSKSSASLHSICSTDTFAEALKEEPLSYRRERKYISDSDVEQLLSNARVCTRLCFDIDSATKFLSNKISSTSIHSKENLQSTQSIESSPELRQLTALTRELVLKTSEIDVCSLNLRRASFFDYLKGSKTAFVKFGVTDIQQRIKFAQDVKAMAESVEWMNYAIPKAISLTGKIIRKSHYTAESIRSLKPKYPAILSVHQERDLTDSKVKSVAFDIEDPTNTGIDYLTEMHKHVLEEAKKHDGKTSTAVQYLTQKISKKDVMKDHRGKSSKIHSSDKESLTSGKDLGGLSGTSIPTSASERSTLKHSSVRTRSDLPSSTSVSKSQPKESSSSQLGKEESSDYSLGKSESDGIEIEFIGYSDKSKSSISSKKTSVTSDKIEAKDVDSSISIPDMKRAYSDRHYRSEASLPEDPDAKKSSSSDLAYYSENNLVKHPAGSYPRAGISVSDSVSTGKQALQEDRHSSLSQVGLISKKSSLEKQQTVSDINLTEKYSSDKLSDSQEKASLEKRYPRDESSSLTFSDTTSDVQLKARSEERKSDSKRSLEEKYSSVREQIMENIGLREKSASTKVKSIDHQDLPISDAKTRSVLSGIDQTLVKLKRVESGEYYKSDKFCKELGAKIDYLKDQVKDLKGDLNVQSLHDQFNEYSSLTLHKLEALASVSKDSLEAAEAQIAIHKANAKKLSDKLRETEELLRESINECLTLKQRLKEEETRREIDKGSIICDLKETLEKVSDFNELETAVKQVVTSIDGPRREAKSCTSDFFCMLCQHGEGHKLCQEKIKDLRSETRKLTTELKIMHLDLKREKASLKMYQEECEMMKKELLLEKENKKETHETLAAKNVSLLDQVQHLRERLKNMERFRKLEIEGFHTDIKNVKSRIKDLEKQLVKAVLIFEQDQKDMELLKTVHATAQRSRHATSAIKRLKAKLYELETDIRNL